MTGTGILLFTEDHYHVPRGGKSLYIRCSVAGSSQKVALPQQFSSGPELRPQLGQFWMSFADSSCET